MSGSTSSLFKSRRRGQRGGMQMALLVVAVSGIIIGAIVSYVSQSVTSVSRQRADLAEEMVAQSAIETFQSLFRLFEAAYMVDMRDCEAGKIFSRALRGGHRCMVLRDGKLKEATRTIPVFRAAHLDGLPGELRKTVELEESWSIGPTTTNSPGSRRIMTLKFDESTTAKVYMASVFDPKSRLEFVIDVKRGDQPVARTRFWMLASESLNRVHLESHSARLVMEQPVADDFCQNQTWGPFSYMREKSCRRPSSMGSAVGLTVYGGKIFALTGLGTVTLLTPETGEEVTVPPSGRVGGVRIFPPYERDQLIGWQDFEIMGEDQGLDYIVGVRGEVGNARLVQAQPGQKNPRVICDVRDMGWGTSLSGLAPTSNAQVWTDDQKQPTVTSFFVKTDNGKMLYLLVKATKGASGAPDVEKKYVQNDPKSGLRFTCLALMDDRFQAVEYLRTLGMANMRTNRRVFVRE